MNITSSCPFFHLVKDIRITSRFIKALEDETGDNYSHTSGGSYIYFSNPCKSWSPLVYYAKIVANFPKEVPFNTRNV